MTMLLLLLLLGISPLSAQPAIQWDNDLGGTGQDELASLQQTKDGGYILGGNSNSPASGDKTENAKGGGDYWVVKLDAAGNKQWDRTFGGSGADGLAVIQQTQDGGYILGGTSDSPGSGDKTEASRGASDYWVVKLDAAGNKQWDKTFGGSGHDNLASLQQTQDGGYILGGTSDSPVSGNKTEANEGDRDFWLLRLDASGNKQWDRTFGGTGSEDLAGLQQTQDGGYVLGGTSDSPASGDKTEASWGGDDYWVLRLDAAGNKVWDKTFGGTLSDALRSLEQTQDGGYILGGNSNSPPNTGNKTAGRLCPDPDWVHTGFAWVVKLDAAGNKQWEQIYGSCISAESSSADRLNVIVQTREGGYLFGGRTDAGACDREGCRDAYWLVKLDAQGTQEWVKIINGEFFDNLADLQQTREDGFVVGGSSNSPVSGDKTDPNVVPCEEDEDEFVGHCSYDIWVVKLVPLPGGGQLQSFTLINTETDQPIRPLDNGVEIDLEELETRKLNIQANTVPATVGSVRFQLSGRQKRTQLENEAPYALFGDKQGDYNAWTPQPGSYTLTATPYAKKDGKGQAGTPLTIHFTVRPPQVVSFMLINTASEQPIRPLYDGDKINLADLPAKKLNIRADTRPATVGSVKFQLSGRQKRIQLENEAPYALFGDSKGDFNKWTPLPGSYTLTATAYSEKNGKGTAGPPLTIHFTVVNQVSPVLASPAIEWDRTIGGNKDDRLTSIQQTQDGGYILGGLSISDASGDKSQGLYGTCEQDWACSRDFWVVKLDAAGNKVWDKTFGGIGEDGLNALQQTSDGGYILAGWSDSPIGDDKTEANRGSGDYWVVKLDANGNKQWDRTYGGNEGDDLRGLQQTQDGGYILGGFSYSGLSGDKTQASRGGADFWVVKLDAAGNKQWDKTIGGIESEDLHALRQLPDGGYLLGGTSNSPISGDKSQSSRGRQDYWLVRLDGAGNKIWDKTFGGSGSDRLHSAQQTRDGGFVLGGMSDSGFSGDRSASTSCPGGVNAEVVWVVKLDKAGNKQWDRAYCASIGVENEFTDVLNVVVQTRDEGYLIGRDVSTDGFYDFRVIKLDAAGNQEWDRNLGGTGQENLIEYQQTRDGGYILGGRSNSPVSGDKTQESRGGLDFWVVKLAPLPKAGQLQSFTLINAESEQPIRLLQDGEEINLATLPAQKLNMEANTFPVTVGSVRFELSGRQSRVYVDNDTPYALFGDRKGDYNKWYPKPGSYTLTATPYARKDGRGEAGTPLTIRFTVVNQPAGVAGEVSPAQRIPAPQAARPGLLPRLTLYPNPTDEGRLQVQLSHQVQGQVRYRLLSPVGSKLAEGSLDLPKATNLLELDFSGQMRAAGLYYLRLEGAGLQQVLRILRR